MQNEYVVFRGAAAGYPGAFECDKWYYEPQGWNGGVFSAAYDTFDQAAAAAQCDSWAYEL